MRNALTMLLVTILLSLSTVSATPLWTVRTHLLTTYYALAMPTTCPGGTIAAAWYIDTNYPAPVDIIVVSTWRSDGGAYQERHFTVFTGVTPGQPLVNWNDPFSPPAGVPLNVWWRNNLILNVNGMETATISSRQFAVVAVCPS